MKNMIAVLVVSLGVMTPCLSASDGFSTDKPSPLKPAKPGKDDDRVVHFTGSVQLSGQFLVRWEIINNKPYYLRAVFFPDKESTTLLPHAAETGPVKELLFPNAQQATSMLLESETAQRLFAKELLIARGEATLTIGDYRTVVECDHRWYMAELISVSKNSQIVASVRENGRFGC
jgi:hypothetical protein